MANELKAAEHFFYARLHGSSALMSMVSGVFGEFVPRDVLPPFVVFSFQGSRDVAQIGVRRQAIEPLYLVRVYGQTGKLADIQPQADEIDNVLHRAGSGVYEGYTVSQCVREDVYSFTDTSEVIPWRMLGGYYRLYITVG